MRLATIDLGTNTVRLLVADADARGGWHPVDEAQRVTRLGEGLGQSGRLGEAPMARTVAVIADYVKRARDAGTAEIHIVATSAVREAANGAAFAGEVERRTGSPVTVVSGDDEARLTVLGVLAGLREVREPLLAFDIGGGSTEFILAEGGRVRAARSLRLGVVPLTERFPFPGPVDAGRYRTMLAEIRARLEAELGPALRGATFAELVGTAGTVTTLAALDLALVSYDPVRVQGHRLTRPAVERLRRRLGALTVDGRADLPCLEPGRADLIVPGIAIVEATLGVLGVESLLVSDWGLREGIMVDVIERARARPAGP